MRKKTSFEERFFSKARILDPSDPNSCILWTGAINKASGYGTFRNEGRVRQAHRVLYEVSEGVPADGLVLDHTCTNRWCVNLAHLEPVTVQENVLRGKSATSGGASPSVRWANAMYARRVAIVESGGTVMPKCGHEIRSTEDMVKGNGTCRRCHNARQKVRAHKLYYNKERA